VASIPASATANRISLPILYQEETYNDECGKCIEITSSINQKVLDGQYSMCRLGHSDCVNFVETFADELVNMYVAGMKPAEMCQTLKKCTNEENEEDNQVTEDDGFLGPKFTGNVFFILESLVFHR
jgi:Saposin-like type B, region 2